jgi:hypothetical protein
MTPRRITHGLGAAAGGLLAAAFLPMTVANADGADLARLPVVGTPDVFGFATDTSLPNGGAENVLTVSGLVPLDQQVEGYQTFDFFTPAAGTTPAADIGTVNADVSTLRTPIGFTNTEYLVTGHSLADVAPVGTTAADLPTVGSTYDIASFDGFENIYSSVAPEAVPVGTSVRSRLCSRAT